MYGFSVNCDGNAVAQMKMIEGEMGRMGAKSTVEGAKVAESFHKAGAAAKGFFAEYKGLLLGGLAAGGIFGGIHFIESSLEAYDKVEKAVMRVNTVIQSTKGAAGISANSIEEQAKELSRSILQGRAEIMDAQGMLLSFTGIKGPIFSQTTQAVADFATFYKTDMTSAALQIGKALNNPLMGMNRLQRVGVAFTEQQKEQIKNYMAQGNLLAAQHVIIKELNTEFGGQSKAAALTDEGKIAMASKQWGALKLQLGEVFSHVQVSLIPAFTSMVKYIKEAFNSDIVQFFLHHIKDLVELAIKMIPIWLTYKAVMLTVSAVTSIAAVKNGVLTLSMGSLTVMTDGATVATEGFKVALSTLGIGALIIGIGLLIEKFISWNSKINETVDGLTHIKDITSDYNAVQEQFSKTDLTLSNVDNLSKTQKSALYSDITNQIEDVKNKIATTLVPAIAKSKKELADMTARKEAAFKTSQKMGVGFLDNENVTRSKVQAAIISEEGMLKGLNKTLSNLQAGKGKLDAQGVKALTPSKYENGTKLSALQTSELAGAKGGLGEAKIINIRIDTMQKVEVKDGQGLKDKSQEAIEILTRTLNNLAYSQGSM